MSAQPPLSPVAPPKPDADGLVESRLWKWFDRFGDLLGMGVVAIFILLGWSRLRLAGAILLPEVPGDASQLERIEALAERTSGIAMANQHLIEMFFCFAAAGVVFFVTVKLDNLFFGMKALRRENADLYRQIGEYQDRELQELERDMEELDEGIAERREQRSALFSSLFGPDTLRRRGAFDSFDAEDDNLPPFPPPKKPPTLN